MHRREFLMKSVLGLAASPLVCLQGLGSSAPGKRKPNIIVIMADDLGYECIGANGGTSYRTPVLDGMARSGIRFEHCYAQPLCTPSRVQIMTGIYNVRNYVKFGVLDREQSTFAHLLKRNGYATCIAGKWQLGKEADAPRHFGFDEYCLWQHTRGRTDEDGHDTRYPNPHLDTNGELICHDDGQYGPDVASDFVCDFMERNQKKPFLVYYPMILTHCPFVATPDSPDWDPASKGSTTYKGDPKYFGDMVYYMDKMIGKLLAKLKELGLEEDTLVLFTGDNGTDEPVVSNLNGCEVAGAKGRMTDAGTRVPLIARWPGVIPEGSVGEDLVDFSDFLPTLCEAGGMSVPAELNIDGRSFLPQLTGKKGHPREWIYCWYSRNGGPTGREWARNQRYKLYRSGEFYDVPNDVLEQKPLKVEDLTAEAKQAYIMLKAALNRYRDARPRKFSRTD